MAQVSKLYPPSSYLPDFGLLLYCDSSTIRPPALVFWNPKPSYPIAPQFRVPGPQGPSWLQMCTQKWSIGTQQSMRLSMCTYKCTYTYVYMHTYVYILIYIYVYTHSHAYLRLREVPVPLRAMVSSQRILNYVMSLRRRHHPLPTPRTLDSSCPHCRSPNNCQYHAEVYLLHVYDSKGSGTPVEMIISAP